jgi:hypothetical protein
MRKIAAQSITTGAEAVRDYFSAAAEEWYSMLQLPIGGYDQVRDVQSMPAMGRTTSEWLSALLPMLPLYRMAPQAYTSTADVLLGPLYMDVITLKQIRDPQNVQCAAFQSVVRSTMYLDRVYDYGCLFNLMAADPTTDIKILIHSKPEQQIVESLGLEVSDIHGSGAAGVSVLKPRFPYWVNMDLVYGLGTNLYWRGRGASWSNGELPTPPNGRPPARYNTFGSGAQQENPFAVVSPKGLIYIATLPLKGPNGAQKLGGLIEALLCNDRYTFSLYHPEGKPPHIWLLVRNINDSGVGLPPSEEQELVLGTFVEWTETCAPYTGPPGIGFLPLFAITDSQSRALTYSEVFGRPIMLGTFDSGGAKWPWPAVGPESDFEVLTVKTDILPTLYTGAAPKECELISIVARQPASSPKKYTYAGQSANPWYPSSLVIVSVAQVIDCRLPEKDIYQSIVMQLMKKTTMHEASAVGDVCKELKYDLCVKFTRYESMPIVQTLCLETAPPEAGSEATIEEATAENHGWINTGIEENGSIDFAWRIGASRWQYPADWLCELKGLEPEIEEDMESLRRFIAEF